MSDTTSQMMTSRGLGYRVSYMLDRANSAFSTDSQTVLVTGFWRSGTTWLQENIAEAINAKTIFEPFSPKSNPPFNREQRFDDRDQERREGFMPVNFDQFTDKDLEYIDNLFDGHCPARFSYLCRSSIRESLRSNTVVKLVRAHFVLDDLVRRYEARTIHVTRHPCAVVASLQNTKWEWSFADVRFKDLIPDAENAPAALRDDFAKLLEYDERAPHERMAAYWAVSEKYVASLKSELLLKVSYEELVEGGREAFSAITKFLGEGDISNLNLAKSSVVTAPGREGASAASRLQSWKTKISPETRSDIARVIEEFWPEALVRWPDICEESVGPAAN